MTDDDLRHMRRALRLAARAAGRTSPDPLGGAVLVKDGRVVAEALHRGVGQPHAEAAALAKAGDQASGATLYLALEPCAHGAVPPCAEAIAAARVARVIAALRDPDPRTDGRGFRSLRAAGVAVEQGLLEQEAARLNEGFLKRVREGRPFVLLQLAVTADGRTAAPGRRPLIGKPSQRELHRLRDRYDAVLLDVAKIESEDPDLVVREVKGRDPLRVVLDADARTPPAARVVRAADPQRTIVFVGRDADQRRVKRLRDAGVLLATLPRATESEGLDPAAALRWLGERGVNTVLCEAGPRVAGSLLRARLADRLMLFVAPLAGGDGPPALPGLPSPVELRGLRSRRIGSDLVIESDL